LVKFEGDFALKFASRNRPLTTFIYVYETNPFTALTQNYVKFES